MAHFDWSVPCLALAFCSCHHSSAADPPAGSSSHSATVAVSSEPVPSASTSAPPQDASIEDASVDAALDGALDAAPTSQTPCPPEMEQIGRSCVDKWESHLVQLNADGSESEHPHFQRPKNATRYKAVSTPNSFPQGYISRPEAQSACENAGKRLCSLGEWYRACQGPRGLRFSYGMHETPGKCNTRKAHLLSKFFGSHPGAWKHDENFNSPMLNQQEGFLARTGQYEQCASGGTVFDMVGNLHEWVSDTVDEALPKKIPLEDNIRDRVPHLHGHGIFMGGFYSTGKEHGHGCGFITIGHEPSYHDYSTGFRCCKRAQSTDPPKKKKKK